MKKIVLISGISLTAVMGAVAIIIATMPVTINYGDDILSPYLTESVIPFVDETLEKTVNSTNLFTGDMPVQDTALLPDQTLISVGQVLTNRNVYAPAIARTDLSGGVMWDTFINPVDLNDLNYAELGTSFNTFHHVIYVNPDLIYVVGSIRAMVYDTEGNAYPLAGFFRDAQVPMGDDLLTFILSFTQDFSQVKFHGFLTPSDEAGLQQTIVSDVTLINATTMVLTGITNSHAGLFATGPSKNPYDFVIRIQVGESLSLQQLFSFNHDTYVQPSQVYALANGDIIVSGQVLTATGDFAEIPFNQNVQAAGFIARIDGINFTLEWVQSNLTMASTKPAVSEYLNVIELTTHQLATVINVIDSDLNQTRQLWLTILSEKGTIQIQTILTLSNREVTGVRLFKAQTGYWLVATVFTGTNPNIALIKLTPKLELSFLYEILGSGEETWSNKPFLHGDTLLLPIRTTSKDEDFAMYQYAPENSKSVIISIKAIS